VNLIEYYGADKARLAELARLAQESKMSLDQYLEILYRKGYRPGRQ
jgi:hypothetical protein